MNFFTGIFQGFWPKIYEHLFYRTPLANCFCNSKSVLLGRSFYDDMLYCIFNEKVMDRSKEIKKKVLGKKSDFDDDFFDGDNWWVVNTIGS